MDRANLMTPISAIVLTKNEETRLPDCLATLTWADEVLVVDSYSTDGTQAIAEQIGARFVQHPFSNFSDQRNYAQSVATHDWVFFVDADERVTPELRQEILDLARSDQLDRYALYHVQRIHLFSGRWFPDPKHRKIDDSLRRQLREREMVRLLDRRRTHWERELHEEAVAAGPHGALEQGYLLHYSHTNLHERLDPLNFYTSLESALLNKTRCRRVPFVEAAFRALRHGVYAYIKFGWWREGDTGLTMAALSMFTKFIDYAKLDERIRIAHNEGVWTDEDRALLKRFP